MTSGPAAPRVLILGGTGEARDLADALTEAQIPMVSSLAGRVAQPRLPVGGVRIGGFGGKADVLAACETYTGAPEAMQAGG